MTLQTRTRLGCVLFGLCFFLPSAAFAEEVATEGDVEPPTLDVVSNLAQQLGSEQYRQREEAQVALLEFGEPVLPLIESLDLPSDPEVSWRVKSIVRKLRRDPLIGTSWYLVCSGDVKLNPQTITLLDNGRFNTTGPSKQTPHNDAWETADADAGLIRIYFNDKYATYEGQQTSNHLISGTATNIKGKQWTWSATRVESSFDLTKN